MTQTVAESKSAIVAPSDAPPVRAVGALASLTLWQREVVRFLRQRSRVVGALGSPVVFWALIGLGLGRSFHPQGSTEHISYLEYFFPGTLVLILLFTSIFSTISIIEDRREGFLQSVLVSPAPRWTIVMGKILGGATLAWLQGMLFCALAPLSGIHIGVAQLVGLAAVVFLVGFALTGLGFLVAWPLDSSQGFHAIMNLFLIPLWLLSGALFPESGAPAWLQWAMRVNPVTYCVSAVRAMLYTDVSRVTGTPPPSLWVSLLVVAAFAVATFGASVVLARRDPAG